MVLIIFLKGKIHRNFLALALTMSTPKHTPHSHPYNLRSLKKDNQGGDRVCLVDVSNGLDEEDRLKSIVATSAGKENHLGDSASGGQSDDDDSQAGSDSFESSESYDENENDGDESSVEKVDASVQTEWPRVRGCTDTVAVKMEKKVGDAHSSYDENENDGDESIVEKADASTQTERPRVPVCTDRIAVKMEDWRMTKERISSNKIMPSLIRMSLIRRLMPMI